MEITRHVELSLTCCGNQIAGASLVPGQSGSCFTRKILFRAKSSSEFRQSRLLGSFREQEDVGLTSVI